MVIKLDTPEGADESLRETVEQSKYCTNTASEWCWHGDDGYHVTSKSKTEHSLYDRLRDKTDLTANLVQNGGFAEQSKPPKAESPDSNVAITRPNPTSRQTARCTTSGVRPSTVTMFLYLP